MFFIILVIGILILWFFGGNIVLGLIMSVPLLLIFHICNLLGLPDFVSSFLVAIFYGCALILPCIFGKSTEEEELYKSTEWFHKEFKIMSEDQKQRALRNNEEAILKLEEDIKLIGNIDKNVSNRVHEIELKIKQHKIYLEILQGIDSRPKSKKNNISQKLLPFGKFKD